MGMSFEGVTDEVKTMMEGALGDTFVCNETTKASCMEGVTQCIKVSMSAKVSGIAVSTSNSMCDVQVNGESVLTCDSLLKQMESQEASTMTDISDCNIQRCEGDMCNIKFSAEGGDDDDSDDDADDDKSSSTSVLASVTLVTLAVLRML